MAELTSKSADYIDEGICNDLDEQPREQETVSLFTPTKSRVSTQLMGPMQIMTRGNQPCDPLPTIFEEAAAQRSREEKCLCSKSCDPFSTIHEKDARQRSAEEDCPGFHPDLIQLVKCLQLSNKVKPFQVKFA